MVLKGNPTLSKALASLKTISAEKEGILVKLLEINTTGKSDTVKGHPPVIEELLREFADLFNAPTGLPPRKDKDHTTCLRKELQKNEIERLITEMLASGIIRPSNSPFRVRIASEGKRW